VLPTVGGQTALNLASSSRSAGAGAPGHPPDRASASRGRGGRGQELFKEAMTRIGLDVPRSGSPRAWTRRARWWRPRPARGDPASFTLGAAAAASRTTWRSSRRSWRAGSTCRRCARCWWRSRARLEGVRAGGDCRDRARQLRVICSIENFDPMGIHTGDSVTVAPAQTLTDASTGDAQRLAPDHPRGRVETGGSNIQFAWTRRRGAWS